MRRIKQMLAVVLVVGFSALTVLNPVLVKAYDPVKPYDPDPLSKACQLAPDSAACQGVGTTKDPVSNTITNVANVIAIVAGVAAVIMIIVASLTLVLSGGDTAKAKTARTAIIYALVGLIVIVFARLIVALTINQTS